MTTVAMPKKLKERHPLAIDFRLYLITDRHQTGGKPLIEAVEEALRGGLSAVQLREKDLGTRELLSLAYSMRTLTLKQDARLFINDRLDIAIAVDADGIHLGQKSIPPSAVRKLSRKLIIGVSVHGIEEALRAERQGADFVTLGPVFSTTSKLKYGRPIGTETLREVSEAVKIPVLAIGGITHENLPEAIDAGADGVAVISGILAAKSIKAATLKFLRQLQ